MPTVLHDQVHQEHSKAAMTSNDFVNSMIKLLKTILEARVTSRADCRQAHHGDDALCGFRLGSDISNKAWLQGRGTVFVDISDASSNMLLESWNVDYQGTDQSHVDYSDLVHLVDSYIRHMPISTLLLRQSSREKDDLSCRIHWASTAGSGMTGECYTGHQRPAQQEFEANARLRRHQFPLVGRKQAEFVNLQVVYLQEPQWVLMDHRHKQDAVDPVAAQVAERLRLHADAPSVQRPPEATLSPATLCHPCPSDVPLSTPTSHPCISRSFPVPPSPIMPRLGVRRLSKLSLSAMGQDMDKDDEDLDTPQASEAIHATALALPIPSSTMQYTHHDHGHVGLTPFAYSVSPSQPTLHSCNDEWPSLSRAGLAAPAVVQRRNSCGLGDHHAGSLIGSYEESLLSGRMSTTPSRPITFQVQIGVLGLGDCKSSLKCPPHVTLDFPAFYFERKDDEWSTPYVGNIDISGPKLPAYRLPPKGQLQIIIRNPSKTVVKFFLIPYDVSAMPEYHKTFLRQKCYSKAASVRSLRYAIHVQICRTKRQRVYLYKHIRVVFARQIMDSHEQLKTVCEGPQEPAYSPLTTTDKDIFGLP